MPAMSAGTPDPAGTGLVLEPFRGVRYDPSRVSSLAAVTAPPYDVVDAEQARALAAADPHNVIRLIVPPPANARGTTRRRHAAAGATWRSWLAGGVLRVDPTPALYGYEQVAGGHRVRGLVGALLLRDPRERVVLPHEEVMPGPVADRLALLEATQANLEPILLVHDAGPAFRDLVGALAQDEPLAEAHAAGEQHRLWHVSEPEALAAVATELAPRQALIADGHHRYASYLAYQHACRARAGARGPWDLGLALLVDAATDPLELRAIDRVIRGLSLRRALDAAHAAGLVAEIRPGDEPVRGTLVLTDLRESVAVVLRPGAAVGDDPPLDVTVLHETLVPAWDVDEADIAYLHDRSRARHLARSGWGLGVLLAPVELAEVTARAARGERMPRKTTSFGPKPRSGLVMRSLLH